MNPTDASRQPLALFALIVGGLVFAALIFAGYFEAGLRIEYPLDDPYIHLAMAEQLAAGGYGVNAGEYAAASSSPLFSFLLLPFVGEPFHRFLPLAWNVIGLAIALVLWGRILWQSGWGTSAIAILVAAGGPLVLNMPGVAYVGMEHSLHLAASLAIVSGLITFLTDKKVNVILILGVLLSPVLRFEGVALAGMAGLIVLFHGRYLSGLVLGALAVLPLVGFAFWLTTLGLEPLPSSVSAKMAAPGGTSTGLSEFFAGKFALYLIEPRAQVLIFLCIVAVVFLMMPEMRQEGRNWLVVAVLAAGVAHLLLGRFGWMNRYEVYVIASVAAGLFAASAGFKRLQLLPLLPLVYLFAIYLPQWTTGYVAAPKTVALQQVQMGRFAKDHYNAPVAVNDLGYVSWQNPNYVLDLWGLANHEARQLRLHGTEQKWVDGLTEKHGTKVAMIYAEWFPGQLGDDWQLLGKLKLDGHSAFLASDTVSFFLTGPEDPAEVLQQLKDWQSGLPAGVQFTFADGFAG